MVLKSGEHMNITLPKSQNERGSRQAQFIKRLIDVNKSTTNIMVHGETGRYPLTMFIKLRTVKFVTDILCHKISINYFRWLMSMKTKFLTQILKYDKDPIYVSSYQT